MWIDKVQSTINVFNKYLFIVLQSQDDVEKIYLANNIKNI